MHPAGFQPILMDSNKLNDKELEQYHEKGPRGLKINCHGVVFDCFDPAIALPTPIRVRNLTYD